MTTISKLKKSPDRPYTNRVIGFKTFKELQDHLKIVNFKNKDVSIGYSTDKKHFYEKQMTERQVKNFQKKLNTHYEAKKKY